MDITFHYPPELLQLLVDTIPRLCRSKKDVLLFFQGAGVPQTIFTDLAASLQANPASVSKFHLARTVLTRLNEQGEQRLGERRQVLRRVVEFEDFSTCWPNDQLQAKGLVSEIRRVVDVKDSFTRINQEREKEAAERKGLARAKEAARHAKEQKLADAAAAFATALAEPNLQRRGTLVEASLNALFRAYEISVREAFRVVSEKSGHVIEQIDGVIELDGHLYLVEMKWLSGPVPVEDVSRHLVRVYHRGQTRGLFLSATTFTEASLLTCREALQQTVVSLALIEELVLCAERRLDLRAVLRRKVEAAQVDKQPFFKVDLAAIPAFGAP